MGKTTLLLQLLGVDDAFAGAVAEVLRAGRPRGSSSTSVATQYFWSDSGEWQFAPPGSTISDVTEAGLMDHLAMLRSSIGRDRSGVQDQPHRVGIPPRYRDPLADQNQWPNVLDLPGSAPKDRGEAAQVTLIAETHVPAAHLIVLVTKSDDLTPLRPSSLREISPVLAAWPLDEDRYRFVFTHTVSNLMGQGDAGREIVSSASTLRSETAQQVSRALRRQVPPDLLFPIEYGDSWSRLKSDRPDVYWSAAEAVRSLVADLQKTLTSVEREDAIFLAALRAPRILERAVQADIDAAGDDVEKTRTRLRRWTSERDEHTAAAQRLQARVAEVQRRLVHLDDAGRRLTDVRFDLDFTKLDHGAELARQQWVHQWAGRFRHFDEVGDTASFGKLRSSAERYADSDLKADVYAALELCVRCPKPCEKKFLGVTYADKWCSSEHCLATHRSRLEKAGVKVSSLLAGKAAELVEEERKRVRADLREHAEQARGRRGSS